MEQQLLEAIRTATAPDASDEAKATGAAACRTILIALEAKKGEPLPAVVPVAAPVPDIAGLIAGLRGVPIDQLLDLAIAKLRTMVPTTDAPPPVHRFAIPLISVPRRS